MQWLCQQLPATVNWQLLSPAFATGTVPMLTIQNEGYVFFAAAIFPRATLTR